MPDYYTAGTTTTTTTTTTNDYYTPVATPFATQEAAPLATPMLGVVRTLDYPEGAEFMLGEDFNPDLGSSSSAQSVLKNMYAYAQEIGRTLPPMYVPFRRLATPAGGIAALSAEIALMKKDTQCMYLLYVNSVDALLVAGRAELTLVCRNNNGVPAEFQGAWEGNVMYVDVNPNYGDRSSRFLHTLCALQGEPLEEDFVLSQENLESTMKETQRRALEDFLGKRASNMAQQLYTSIDRKLSSLAEARERVITLARSLSEDEASYYALQSVDSTATESAVKRDLDELFGYKNLRSITMSGSQVIFRTAPLAMREPDGSGYTRDIGMYEVRVGLDDARANFLALDNKIDLAMWESRIGVAGVIQHPHCSSDGTPCMGNMAAALSDLCAEYDLLGIWQIILGFLTSYNPSDVWGKRAKFWPLRDTEGNLVVAPTIEDKCCMCGTPVSFAEDYDAEEAREAYTCDKCGALMCDECYVYIDADDEHLCQSCAAPLYCANCDEYHGRNEEFTNCDDCGTRICVARATAGAGTYGGEDLNFCNTDHRMNWERDNDYDIEDEFEQETEEETDEI